MSTGGTLEKARPQRERGKRPRGWVDVCEFPCGTAGSATCQVKVYFQISHFPHSILERLHTRKGKRDCVRKSPHPHICQGGSFPDLQETEAQRTGAEPLVAFLIPFLIYSPYVLTSLDATVSERCAKVVLVSTRV